MRLREDSVRSRLSGGQVGHREGKAGLGRNWEKVS